MPRPRKENTRKPNERIFILCEGEKTEPLYFEEIINEVPLAPDLIAIIVYDTKINTAKELIALGKTLKETPRDKVWVVIDKDGYTKHPQSFDMAKANDINIAFSSISFETWVLMHFNYTTKQFKKSANLISYINSQEYFGSDKYEKNNLSCLYKKYLKNNTAKAIRNAKLLRKNMLSGNFGKKIFQIDPWTDIDILLTAISDAQVKFKKK